MTGKGKMVIKYSGSGYNTLPLNTFIEMLTKKS